MDAKFDERVLGKIDLKPAVQDYQISGFSDAYMDYFKGCDGDAACNGWLLIVLGLIVAAAGVGIMIFGPSTITYSRYSGPTLFQYVQMAPGLVVTVGSVFVALGNNFLSKKPISRTAFLLSRYKFIDRGGCDVSSKVQVRHLDKDSFNISIGL